MIKHVTSPRVVLLYLTTFLLELGVAVKTPLLGQLKSEFGISALHAGLITSSFGLARLMLDLPMGVFVDRISGKRLLAGGSLCVLWGSILSGLTPSFHGLLLGQWLIGAGFGLFSTTVIVSLCRLSTSEDRGRTLSVFGASFWAGGFLGPAVGGTIASIAGWRAAFLFSVFTSGLALALTIAGSKLTLSVAALQRDVINEGLNGSLPQALASHPSGNLTSLSAINLATCLLLFLGNGFRETFIPLYGHSILKLSPAMIGMAISIGPIVQAGANLVYGVLLDRYGGRAVLIPGLIIMGLGSLSLKMATNLPTLAVTNAILGVGNSSNIAVLALLTDHIPPTRWGVTMGLNRAIGDMGVMLGPAASGWLIDRSGFTLPILFGAALAWLGAATVSIATKELPHWTQDQPS
jgi:predicted MFS family arabinose efflux permease